MFVAAIAFGSGQFSSQNKINFSNISTSKPRDLDSQNVNKALNKSQTLKSQASERAGNRSLRTH